MLLIFVAPLWLQQEASGGSCLKSFLAYSALSSDKEPGPGHHNIVELFR